MSTRRSYSPDCARARSRSRSRSASPGGYVLPRANPEADQHRLAESTTRFFDTLLRIVNKLPTEKISFNSSKDSLAFADAYTAVSAICDEEKREILDDYVEGLIDFDHHGYGAELLVNQILLSFNYNLFRRLERKCIQKYGFDILSHLRAGQDEKTLLTEFCKKAIPHYLETDQVKQMFFEVIVRRFNPDIAKEVIRKEMRMLLDLQIIPPYFLESF